MLTSKNNHTSLWWFPFFHDSILIWYHPDNDTKDPIYLDKEKRRRHQYIIWNSWQWKTILMSHLARQDIWNWEGVWIIDPIWDLIENIVSYIPKHRKLDVIIFHPWNNTSSMGLNILEITSTDPDIRKKEMNEIATNTVQIFIDIFWTEVFWSDMQNYLKNWCLTVMEDENNWSTLVDVIQLFTDNNCMKQKILQV